jgi:hypothetical protein
MHLSEENDQEACARKNTEPRDRLAAIKLRVDVLDRSHNEAAELWTRAFEHSQILHHEWFTTHYDAKRRILDMMYLNCRLDGAILVREIRKRFECSPKGFFRKTVGEVWRAFRHYRVIHVLCDNAGTHTAKGSKLVRAYLKKWGHRVRVHYVPKYSPDTNPIERVWWRSHEAVTRNHRCQTMAELLDLTFDWFETRTHFRVHSSVYAKTPGK